MIPVLRFYKCKKCNNTHEYIIDKKFLDKIGTELRVRCAICGNIRERINYNPLSQNG